MRWSAAMENWHKIHYDLPFATGHDRLPGLLINGSLQQEQEIYQKTERYQEGGEFPLTVPEGQVFVLGDSRSGATDSRIYGSVEIEDTLGKVMTVIRRRSI